MNEAVEIISNILNECVRTSSTKIDSISLDILRGLTNTYTKDKIKTMTLSNDDSDLVITTEKYRICFTVRNGALSLLYSGYRLQFVEDCLAISDSLGITEIPTGARKIDWVKFRKHIGTDDVEILNVENSTGVFRIHDISYVFKRNPSGRYFVTEIKMKSK